MTLDEVLDAVRDIAILEHTHLVYYLRFHSALGGDPPTMGDDPRPPAVAKAASAAFGAAFTDMFHLRDANRLLVAGGRDPVLGRVAHLTPASGPRIDLTSMTPADFAHFPAREKALAAAVEDAYAPLRAALASPPSPVPDELRSRAEAVVDNAPHAGVPADLAQTLNGLSPADYLLVTGVAPADEVDRRLLALSDEFYAALLAILARHFADTEGFGFRSEAVQRMEELHKINGILGLRGLLAPFTPTF